MQKQSNSSVSHASVAALFSNEAAAERAVRDLKQAGFSANDIGLAGIAPVSFTVLIW